MDDIKLLQTKLGIRIIQGPGIDPTATSSIVHSRVFADLFHAMKSTAGSEGTGYPRYTDK